MENKKKKRFLKSIKFSVIFTLILSFIVLMFLESGDDIISSLNSAKSNDTVFETILLLLPIIFIFSFLINFGIRILREKGKSKKQENEDDKEKGKEDKKKQKK